MAVPLDPEGCAGPVEPLRARPRRRIRYPGTSGCCADLMDARVYLACLADAGGQVHRWVELWVQHHGELALAPLAARGAISNAQLDASWQKHYRAMRDLEPGALIETGWEQAHPQPLYLDLAARRAVRLPDAEGRGTGDSGGAWQLCRDDALLAKHGLPPYGSSLHRYLYCYPSGEIAAGAPPMFVPVTPGAPENSVTSPLTRLTSRMVDCVPLNPEGGLMMVR